MPLLIGSDGDVIDPLQAVCWSCGVANDTVASILDGIFKVPAQWGVLVKKVLKKPYLLGAGCKAAAIVSAFPTKDRIGLLRTALHNRRAALASNAAGRAADGVAGVLQPQQHTAVVCSRTMRTSTDWCQWWRRGWLRPV